MRDARVSRARRSRGILAAVCLALALTGAPAPATAQEAPSAAGTVPYEVALAVRSMASGRLKAFYSPRAFWPIWVEGETLSPAADRLVELVTTARVDGLDPREYDAEELQALVEQARAEGSIELLAKAELKLSGAFAAYVRDVRVPRLKITYLDKELEPPKQRQRIDEILRISALAPDFKAYVDRMAWMSPAYVRLRDATVRFHERWGALPMIYIPDGAKLRAGSKDPRIAMIRARIGLPPGTAYDKAMGVEVRRYQADHGLPATGLIGEMTIAALNAGEEEFERRLRVNLERARVLPGPSVRHVVVDAASARLWYYQDGAQAGTMKVVVGTPATQTPMLAGVVRYAILNPYWNVPPDLVSKLIAPKVLAGSSLETMRYEALADWTNNPAPLDPAMIDWTAVAEGHEEIRVRQLPGPANSMGKVKFMFPNDLGIYLHDTPDRALFAKPARHFSNGCIRLEDAARLGKWFFGEALTPLSTEPEQILPLPEPVPVYLTYLTVNPTDQGIEFLEDSYGRDAPEQVAMR